MSEPRPPHIETLTIGQELVTPHELQDIGAVEVADADPATDPSIVPRRLAAILDGAHWDQIRSTHVCVRDRPAMFHRRLYGLMIWPPADKQYWFRVSYRAPIKRETRDPLGQP